MDDTGGEKGEDDKEDFLATYTEAFADDEALESLHDYFSSDGGDHDPEVEDDSSVYQGFSGDEVDDEDEVLDASGDTWLYDERGEDSSNHQGFSGDEVDDKDKDDEDGKDDKVEEESLLSLPILKVSDESLKNTGKVLPPKKTSTINNFEAFTE